MIKTKLYIKCANYNFKSLFKQLGYSYFDKGLYNLNIIGVRSNNNNSVTNLFDDILVVIYNDPDKGLVRKLYNITTEPGVYYVCKKLLNPKGAAILVPGQYRGCWQLGLHRGKYTALCQKKNVKVYRDCNLDKHFDLDPKTIQSGLFGINIHRASENKVNESVDAHSAGCQVFNNIKDFEEFIEICKKQKALYGNNFTYTLINEKDLTDE